MDDANNPESPKEDHSHANDVVDVIGDVVETVAGTVEVTNLGCQVAPCLGGLPDCAAFDCAALDCGVLDCAPGCL